MVAFSRVQHLLGVRIDSVSCCVQFPGLWLPSAAQYHHHRSSIILTAMFIRMQTTWTQPDAVPDDCIQAIATILKEVKSIEISEDGYQIRRKDVRPFYDCLCIGSESTMPAIKQAVVLQMPESWEEIIAEVGRRTVHVACLPHTATLEKIVQRFAGFGSVHQVRLLKHFSDQPEHRVFRGTCLIELGTEEEAAAVLATTVEYDDCVVRTQTKADYDAAVKKVRS